MSIRVSTSPTSYAGNALDGRNDKSHPGGGEPEGIRYLARLRGDKANEMKTVTLRGLESAIDFAGSAQWLGAAANAFASAAREMLPEVTILINQLESDAATLNSYASTVEQLHKEAVGLRSKAKSRIAELKRYEMQVGAIPELNGGPLTIERYWGLHTAPDSPHQAALRAKIDEAISALKLIAREWEELINRRRNADNFCVTQLSATISRGGFANRTIASFAAMSPDQLVRNLHGKSAAELRMLFLAHPELAGRMNSASPEGNASLWRSLDPVHIRTFNHGSPLMLSSAQKALLALIPGTLGNLEGIPYTVRDLANRSMVITEGKKLRTLIAEKRSFVLDHDLFIWEAQLRSRGIEPDFLEPSLAAIVAITSALALKGKFVRQLVAFKTGLRPLAAIAVGNMDTASQITVLVPGMNATVASSMPALTTNAITVQNAQKVHNLTDKRESGLAVVAWIGYDTPTLPEVNLSNKAKVGAVALQGFFEGATAARGWTAGENLSVVAHSYGTTTASIALTKTPVENFTMLASAGLQGNIDTVGDLLVDKKNIWVSKAAGDGTAFWGQRLEHPVDPSTAEFGARVFSSEDATLTGKQLQGSDGHDLSPQSEAKLNGTKSEKYGYLDAGTTPLHNAAVTSLGLDTVVGTVTK